MESAISNPKKTKGIRDNLACVKLTFFRKKKKETLQQIACREIQASYLGTYETKLIQIQTSFNVIISQLETILKILNGEPTKIE